VKPLAFAGVAWLMLATRAGDAPPPVFAPFDAALFGAGTTLTNAIADVDADGDPDVFVGFNGTANRLYRNDGAATFTEVGASAGLAVARATRSAAFGDFDADGDPDLALGFAPGVGGVLVVYRNDRGVFSRVDDAGLTSDSTAGIRQLAWVDFDGDDDVDLFVAYRDRPNALFRNDSGGRRFTDIAAQVGLADARKTVGATWADMDQDGDLDLVTANQDGDANGLFMNAGGRFRDIADSAGVAWGGRAPRDATNGSVRPCAEDVDGDGRLDLFFANYGPNGLFVQRSTRAFTDVSVAYGIATDARWDACAFADWDHDGALDLYVNGTVTGGRSYPDVLYRQASGHMSDITPTSLRSLEADHGVVWADLDRDGDLDLALTGVRPDGMHQLMRNDLPDSVRGRSVQVRVLDPRGRATRAGAEVRVYAAGSTRLLGLRVIDAGSGYNAQSDLPAHVGVGREARVDILVTVPRGGRRLDRWVRGVVVSRHVGQPLIVRR
jgi:penicillin G amidase